MKRMIGKEAKFSHFDCIATLRINQRVSIWRQRIAISVHKMCVCIFLVRMGKGIQQVLKGSLSPLIQPLLLNECLLKSIFEIIPKGMPDI